MKKIFAFMTILFLACSLSGCDMIGRLLGNMGNDTTGNPNVRIDSKYCGTWRSETATIRNSASNNPVTVRISPTEVSWTTDDKTASHTINGFNSWGTPRDNQGNITGDTYGTSYTLVVLEHYTGTMLHITDIMQNTKTAEMSGTFARTNPNDWPE